MQITTEVCVDHRSGALAAQRAGVHRIELCTELSVGGLTPSPGLLEAVLELGLPTVVLVRPRAGHFVVDDDEAEQIARDVRWTVRAGAQSVAVGALQPDGTIDQERLARWIEAAEGKPVCFHRAFDGIREPERGLDTLIELGVTRLLTSGGADDVVAGLPALTRWIQRVGQDLEIMPGGGVRAENIGHVVQASGARSIHFSARKPVASPVQWENLACALHADAKAPLARTDEVEVRRYLDALAADCEPA